jgi:DNA-binding MarR family transcriptional regulator
MILKAEQMALLGGGEDQVLIGLRSFPAHKLTLLSNVEFLEQANHLAGNLRETLRLVVDVKQLKDATIPTVLEIVGQILRTDSDNFQDFFINVGSANRNLISAGVAAAFVYGIKAFDVVGDQPVLLPVMKYSYAQAVTEPKMQVLRAIERSGGSVESLERLSALSNFGKPLLSYHIRGTEDGRGLEKLGLVEVERGKRGRLKVSLTALGRTVLSTSPVKS